MTEAYQASLAYLNGRLNYERTGMPRSSSELRLKRMRCLLRLLDDPQGTLRIVHIAGTKGKGSTAAMIAASLSAAGLRTGLFCSPHLHALEERFRIDGRDAEPAELVRLTDAIRPAVAILDAEAARHGQRGPTFFEITTAMGLLHFALRRTDAVVLEVGMGGRLDSTNAVRPLLSVITSISLDHTKQLGTTVEAIAAEKAGILKRRRPAICGVEDPRARGVIRQIAAVRRSPVRCWGTEFTHSYEPPPGPLVAPAAGSVTVQTWRRRWGPIELPLLGPHQAQNAAIALASLDQLAELGLEVPPSAVASAFAGLRFPARVEIMGRSPWLVIDGAHNVASAEALAETLRLCLPEAPRTLVFGTTREKDLEGQLRALLPLFDRVVATRYVENPRAVPPEQVAAAVARAGRGPTVVADDPAQALEVARRLTPRDGLICVAGSLFLAAEARAVLMAAGPGDGARSPREDQPEPLIA